MAKLTLLLIEITDSMPVCLLRYAAREFALAKYELKNDRAFMPMTY
ncbi:MAG: hypothetical protein QM501_06240 [Gimesia sp.]